MVRQLLFKPDRYQIVNLEGSGKGKLVNKKSHYHLDNINILIENPSEFVKFKVVCEERQDIMNNYMEKKTALFDNGIIDADEMGKASKLWKLIENSDGTINANYGYMVYYIKDADGVSQFDWCKNRLKNNPETLQAYMHFNRPKDQRLDNNDQPCTMFTQFTIVDKKLNFTSYMRSNDIIYGMPYNIAYFIKLQRRMCDYLNIEGIDVAMGSLYHNTTSLHLYEDKIGIAETIIGLRKE